MIKEIDIEKIYIPSNFKEPNIMKMRERIEFYNKYSMYKVPIVVKEIEFHRGAKEYALIDGYTSFLIALKWGKSKVKVVVDESQKEIFRKSENKVKEIKLAFENVEVVSFKPNMIKYLVIGEITEAIWVNCYQYENGKSIKWKKCKKISFEITEEGLKAKGKFWDNTTLTDRLKYNDIVSIILIYEDGTDEEIYVPWCEEDEYTNHYQVNNYDNNKVTIEIKKD